MNKKKTFSNHIVVCYLTLISSLLLMSCSTLYTGTFGVGNPTALTSQQSLQSLQDTVKYLKDRVGRKVTIGGVDVEEMDPLTTNRITRIDYTKVNRGEVTVPPGSDTPHGESESGSVLPKLPDDKAATIIETSDKPIGLMLDRFSTLDAWAAEKQRIIDLCDLYQNSRKHNLYKVFFTLWVEPERQYWTDYLWRWASFKGFRNYTKDYHADIMFRILTDGVKVVRLEPEHDGSISDEYFAMMNENQLGLSGTWQGVSARADLAERLREAQVEQRKYPILRSVIVSHSFEKEVRTMDESREAYQTKQADNTEQKFRGNEKSKKADKTIDNAAFEDYEADFRFIVSPRQHVEERAFRIPLLMSPYMLTRRIESVPYHVSAYFLVPNNEKMSERVSQLELDVAACYKQYGLPERGCKENFIRYNAKSDYAKTIQLKIDLPPAGSNEKKEGQQPSSTCHNPTQDTTPKPDTTPTPPNS